MLWPNGTLTRPPITSPFGPRKSPVPGATTMHRGCDFVGYQLVRAIADGTVVRVGTPPGWSGGGIQVWVQHDGFLSRTMHLKSSPPVRVGDVIPEGRILGVMGMTGNVSGVHHHLEIVVNGVQVDPVSFISARLATTAATTNKPATPAKNEEEPMKPLLFQLDTRTDGRWVVVDTTAGTYWVAKNGAQLDFLRAAGRVQEVHGVQPTAVIAGMLERA